MSIDPGSSDIVRWLAGALGATGIALVAWRARSLSGDGMVAAAALGAIVVGAGGWWAGALLVAFFVTASLLSRTGRDRTVISTARGSRRDAVQVVANGGVAGFCALLSLLGTSSWWLLALAGSLAAANADTWSTEIGRTSTSPPRLITTGCRVPAGTSGAISGRGTVGALLGGSLIGILAALGAGASWIGIVQSPVAIALAVSVAGFGGALIDSLLGATIQHQRWCPTCGKQTERAVHRCGTPTEPLRGHPWISNDVVNLACTASGAALAPLTASLLARLL